MIKKTIVTGMVALMSLAAMALPAKRGLTNVITLNDGTKVEVSLVGDEFMHYWQDAYGNKYVPTGEANVFKLADASAVSNLTTRALARKAKAHARRAARRNLSNATDVFQGKKKGLVILVEFTDVKFKNSDSQTLFNRIANEAGYNEGYFQGSVKDYFLAQSRGQFELDFDVVGPVKLAHNMKYYGGNDENGYDLHPEEMIVEACKGIDSKVDFSKYDWDGDGEVDQVYVIYAGYGEADTGKDNTIWPHEYQLSGASMALTLDGVKVDTYACSSELNGAGEVGGIGTMCHEFSHCMGIPDMYDTGYSGNFGMGPFDLMDYGAYNEDGYKPCGYTAYERMISGWLEPVEVRKGAELSVTGMKALTEGGEAYKLINSGNEDEYFLVENRQFSGWDESLPQGGVLITHVDFDQTVWDYNMVNTTGTNPDLNFTNPHQRMTIFHADNDDDSKYYSKTQQGYTKTTYLGDPYPYKGNDSLTNLSRPSNAIYTKNSDGKKYMDVAIRNIAVTSDGVASMDFGPNYFNSSSSNTPTGEVIFSETIDACAGTGGNDNAFSGSGRFADSDFETDNAGWYSESPHGADGCARFGSSKKKGEATTPAIEIDGTATLTFRAAPWGKDDTRLSVSIDGDATISPSSFNMTMDSWQTFTATITGSDNIKIKFTPGKRFFLDDVIVTAASTAVKGIEQNSVKVPVAIYSTDGTLRQALGAGINIVKYSDGTVKKVLR